MADDNGATADAINYRFGDGAVKLEDLPPDADRLNSILTHRTHRVYAEKPVSGDMLHLLLAAAFSTPAKSDLQQCSVIVVRDEAQRAALAGLIPSMPWIAKAPVFMVFCGDSHRIRRISEMRGKTFENDHLDAFLNAAADAAMHLSTFIAAADIMGLGTCAISVMRNHAVAVSEILDLPAHVFPFAGCCLGWPARDGFISMRLPLALTVHEDRYDDAKTERLVDQYDHDRDEKFSIPEASYRYVDAHGAPDFYGWSEDKARQVSKPEREKFGAYIRCQGFNLD